MQPRSPAGFLIIGVAAAFGYSLTARAVSRRRTVHHDRSIRLKVQRARSRNGDLVARAAGPLGKQWLHIPAAVTLGGYLRKKGVGGRAVIPAVAAVTADTVSRIFDRARPQRRPPPGHPEQHKTSFPSGHANETTAVAFTSAYMLARENLVPAAPAFAVATAASIVSPLGRIYLDRHWATDVIAGWCLGITIAAASAAAYEWMTPDRVSG